MDEAARFDRLFAQAEALMGRWELEAATRLLEAARAEGGFPNRLHHDLSVLYAQQGLFAEALAEIEAAIAGDPGNRAVWHHFLAIQKNNPAQPSPAEWRSMHLAFGDTLRDRHDERHLGAVRPTDPRRKLRVGYLCPDTHLATERFVWPVLEHFDADAFEVFAYWCHADALAPMQAAYPRAAHRTLRGLDDEAIVKAIVADSIDIAIDVAGHGAGNVLTALARRPAPVAMTWLDYLATTGMEEVDFRITDAVADPAGAEAAHVERLLRLPSAQWCYRPPREARDAPGVPRSARSGAVFGSVCVPLKLSDTLLDLWARLLASMPGSRLRFLGIPEGRARARIVRRFESAGIDGARLELRPRLAQADFIRELADLDVVLDSHPFSGATSTLDALWQGVPVVTLAGSLAHSRSTASILATLGREAWVARTPEEFLDEARSLANDAPRLARERASLRVELQASPLCDGPAFARSMEAVLTRGWEMRPAAPPRPPREETAAWWRGLASAGPASTERVDWSALADIIDCARADALEAIAAARSEWLLLTDSAHFDASFISQTLPAALLERCDALAALGADSLPSGELATAGAGHVRGASLVADGDRVYASAWLPGGFGRCVALAGGALLARRKLLAGRWTLERSPGAARFHAEVTRVSHPLSREGARLGVAVAFAAAQRRWPDPRDEYASARATERALEIPRWGERPPAAVAMSAALPAGAWQRVLAGLEKACDGP